MVVRFLVEQYRLSASTSHQFDAAQATARAGCIFDRSKSIQSTMNHGPISFNRWQRERLNEVRVPTLVIHGFEDAVLPFLHGEALSKEIPTTRLLTLPGVGHELPGRVWNFVLPAILQQTSSS
jgi:pimeloyl-ACP methyl ester carboxylesterase